MTSNGSGSPGDFPPRLKTSLGKALPTFYSGRDRWHLAALLLISVLAALTELMGVASVAPFMAVLLNPGELDRMPFLSKAIQAVGAKPDQEALRWLGFAVCALILINSAVTAVNIAYQAWFANRQRALVSNGLFAKFIHQPYSFHAHTESGTLFKLLENNVDALSRTTSALLVIASRGLAMVAMIGLLVAQAPSVALVAVGAFGGTYALIFSGLRKWQVRLGYEASANHVLRNRTALESFGSIKELLALDRLQVPLATYSRATSKIAGIQARTAISWSMPRNIVEPIGMMAIVFIAVTLVQRDNVGAAGAISTLALFAFVALRIVPSLQQFYGSIMEIKHLEPQVIELHSAWINTTDAPLTSKTGVPVVSLDRQAVGGSPLLEARNLKFKYSTADRAALNDVSFTVERGEAVGVVGRSGSGKTTLIDVLLGLYEPQGGELRLDGSPLTTMGLSNWRRRVGYVPQQVFLTNATIAENVALGLSIDMIDRDAVVQALQQAQCLEFIQSLPDGIDSVVGERGVRLSGGQRQRIGIARALYHDPEILILDEATSALDSITEDAVMAAVNALRKQRTLLIIAHRLRTVQACDRLLVLNEGKLVGNDAPEILLRDNDMFRMLAAGATAA